MYSEHIVLGLQVLFEINKVTSRSSQVLDESYFIHHNLYATMTQNMAVGTITTSFSHTHSFVFSGLRYPSPDVTATMSC